MRPIKGGIDYFPLDVVLDEKFDLIEAEYGLSGFAVVLKLLQRIYGQGYYCRWTEEVALLFARQAGMDVKLLQEIVTSAVKREIFHRELWKKYGILTSRGIQRRYFDVVGRRRNIEVNPAYLLVDVTPKTSEPAQQAPAEVNACNNPQNACNNPENACNNAQRKEEEIKENQTKGEQTKKSTPRGHSPPKTLYAVNVALTDEEYGLLSGQFGHIKALRMIEVLSDYKGATGKEYHSDYLAIRNWVVKRVLNEPPTEGLPL